MKTRQDRMNGSIAWMARNPVAANLLMVGLIVCGMAMAIFMVKKEVWPPFVMDAVQISVPYPGASPEEVEIGILRTIEEAVRPIDGVKEVFSVASEGFGNVTAQLETSADRNQALADVKNAIDRILTFPRDAERPIVQAPIYKNEAIWLVIYGDADPLVLRKIAENVQDELLEADEISYVEMDGQDPLEIAVEVPNNTLRRYGLTLTAIAEKIRRTAMDIPAGGVKTKGGEYLLRTTERREAGEEFADIPIITSAQGNSVTLGDIAHIDDGFRESDAQVSFEGKNVIWLNIYSVGDQSPPEVARATKRFVAGLQGTLPPGVEVTTWHDQAEDYSKQLHLLRRNALMGLVLVLVILGLFLDPRVSFWVTMGIPVAFLGSFLFLPAMDVSLNLMSMFAFIVVLGMVVDDAIVVGENIYRMRKEGVPPKEAAVKAARQVAMPVFFSVATTVAAFSPLLFVPGTTGNIVFAIPAVVVITLALSLVESFFILPAHLAHMKMGSKAPRAGAIGGIKGLFFAIGRGQAKVSNGLETFIRKIYAPFIDKAIRRRWITLAIWVAVLITTRGFQAGGFIKSELMPEQEIDFIRVDAQLPFGVPVEETIKLKDKFIAAVDRVIEKNGGRNMTRGILSVAGRGGSHSLRLFCTLAPAAERSISSKAFADQWREEVGDIPGIQSLSFNSTTGGGGKPINIQLSHRDTSVLEDAARDLAGYLRGFKGVKDVEDGIEYGKTQFDFTLSKAGIAAGFTTANVASQVRAAYYGHEALRQQRGRDEIRVLVRLPRSERESLGSVENLILLTPGGAEMPLREVVDVKEGRAYSSIRRTDGKRVLNVRADIVEGEANTGEVVSALYADYMPKLETKFPGVRFEMAGRQKGEDEFMEFLLFGFIIALFVMYGLIAIPLKSYLQPIFVVMIAIPFGFVGAILGHILLGLNLGIFSWIGMAALSGVVVNDSIVFVDAANRNRRNGMSAMDAAKDAALGRFRPIMLTSLTTFAGLSPMIFETSLVAIMVVPTAVSLGFGVLISTFVILTLVPCMFVIVENVRTWPERRRQLQKAHRAKFAQAGVGLGVGLWIIGLTVSAVPTNAHTQEVDSVEPAAPMPSDSKKTYRLDYVEPELRELTAGTELTFAEAIRLADERNISIGVARTEIETADANLSRSRGVLFPDISGSVTLTHLDEETPFRKQDTVDGSLNVTVPLVNPYAWAGVGLAKDARRVSELSTEGVRQVLLLTVAQAYYQALTAKAIIEVNEEQIRSSARHMEVAKTRLLSGVGKTLDVIRAKSDLVRLREQLLSAHTAFDNARDTLGMLTGTGGLPIPVSGGKMEAPTSSEPTLIEMGLNKREDLKLAKAMEEMNRAQKKAEWMQFLPSLNFSWQLTHQFTEPVDPIMDRTGWTAFLTLSVPIYNQTRYADLDSSRATVKKSKLETEDVRQKAVLEIRQSRRDYETAVQKVQTADTQANLAKETLLLTETEYVSGTGSSLEVTDARRSSNEAEINLASRRFEAQIALLRLLRAAGRDMTTL